MAEILELSDQEFKIPLFNILRAVMEKSGQQNKTNGCYMQRDGNSKK